MKSGPGRSSRSGPPVAAMMVELFGENILELPYYFLRSYEVDGMPVMVSRTGYTAELGYEIYLFDATQNGVRLWDAVRDKKDVVVEMNTGGGKTLIGVLMAQSLVNETQQLELFPRQHLSSFP